MEHIDTRYWREPGQEPEAGRAVCRNRDDVFLDIVGRVQPFAAGGISEEPEGEIGSERRTMIDECLDNFCNPARAVADIAAVDADGGNRGTFLERSAKDRGVICVQIIARPSERGSRAVAETRIMVQIGCKFTSAVPILR